jgi:hypothetical protein
MITVLLEQRDLVTTPKNTFRIHKPSKRCWRCEKPYCRMCLTGYRKATRSWFKGKFLGCLGGLGTISTRPSLSCESQESSMKVLLAVDSLVRYDRTVKSCVQCQTVGPKTEMCWVKYFDCVA